MHVLYFTENDDESASKQGRVFYGVGLPCLALCLLGPQVGLATSRVTAFRDHKAHIQTYTQTNIHKYIQAKIHKYVQVKYIKTYTKYIHIHIQTGGWVWPLELSAFHSHKTHTQNMQTHTQIHSNPIDTVTRIILFI